MLDQFHIRPWEYNGSGDIYKEDLANMILLKRIQNEAEKYNLEKQQWRDGVISKRTIN